MTTRPYHQNSDQREREAILRNDRANTFAGRAQAEADDVRGRWAQEHKATVIGAGPVVYPRLPENSWTNDPTGVEPSLGIDVNAVEPCGEKFEIEALGDGEAVAQSSPLAGETVSASVDDPSGTGDAEAPTVVLAPASPAEVSPRPTQNSNPPDREECDAQHS
jgi:hypothetical protein